MTSETRIDPPVELSGEDKRELKELIVELLAKEFYEGLNKTRIHKILFVGEIWAAQQTGHRLTEANFIRYDYGPFSKEVAEALDELVAEGRAYGIESGYSDHDQFTTDEEHGDLTPKKRYFVEKVHELTKKRSNQDLVNMAKESWLWKNFEYEEEIDFTTYIDEIAMDPALRHVADLERDPVDEPDLERLLS